MEKTQVIATIRRKYKTLQSRLNERTRRLWAATEAHAIGHGGIAIVQQAIGMDAKTIRKGLREMNDTDNGVTQGFWTEFYLLECFLGVHNHVQKEKWGYRLSATCDIIGV